MFKSLSLGKLASLSRPLHRSQSLRMQSDSMRGKPASCSNSAEVGLALTLTHPTSAKKSIPSAAQ